MECQFKVCTVIANNGHVRGGIPDNLEMTRRDVLHLSPVSRNRAFIFEIIAPVFRQGSELVPRTRGPMRHSPGGQFGPGRQFQHQIVMRPLDSGVMQNDVTK